MSIGDMGEIKEIQAKSILRKRRYLDSWFVSRCGMNLYRGCRHNCAYCDGRAEGYYVEGQFGREVSVKINAAEILRKELDPARRRKPLKPGYILLGGGVGDSYQPAEEKYGLSRKALEVIAEFGFPVQVLTKSTLIRRDLDLLKAIDSQSRAVVSFSLSSVDEHISRVFEPGVPSPRERLDAIKRFKDHGLACGLFLLPVIPFITDGQELLERAVREARDAGVDYLLFGGMTLKEGRQTAHFLNVVSTYRPDLLSRYRKLYTGDCWGRAAAGYYEELQSRFGEIAAGYRVPLRMPPELYADLLDENDRLVVALEHLDDLLRLQGKRSGFGFAARAIAALEEPVSKLLYRGANIAGVNASVKQAAEEILKTGTSALYERLLRRPGSRSSSGR
jgi:DNA repair photolyase